MEAVPFSNGGQILTHVHERKNWKKTNPSLFQLVSNGHHGQEAAAFARHSFVRRPHAIVESLKEHDLLMVSAKMHFIAVNICLAWIFRGSPCQKIRKRGPRAEHRHRDARRHFFRSQRFKIPLKKEDER